MVLTELTVTTNGADGADGNDGADGEDGTDGQDGQDGQGATADLPDTITYSEYDHSANVAPAAEVVLGALISEVTEGTSDDEFLTVTTTHEQFSNVPAYSYFKTRTLRSCSTRCCFR